MSHPSLSLDTSLSFRLSLILSRGSFFALRRIRTEQCVPGSTEQQYLCPHQSLSQVKQAAERPFTPLYIQRTERGGRGTKEQKEREQNII